MNTIDKFANDCTRLEKHEGMELEHLSKLLLIKCYFIFIPK